MTPNFSQGSACAHAHEAGKHNVSLQDKLLGLFSDVTLLHRLPLLPDLLSFPTIPLPYRLPPTSTCFFPDTVGGSSADVGPLSYACRCSASGSAEPTSSLLVLLLAGLGVDVELAGVPASLWLLLQSSLTPSCACPSRPRVW
uniref:(northern house mosquito) hypothetical protein n=1 Tax=Culex pipiens TaxID=7175 RepID=A0A8D8C987_CULPI